MAQTSGDGGLHVVGADDRAGLPGPRVDPRRLRARRAAARAAERPRRDRLLRRGQDLGAPLGRRRRDAGRTKLGDRAGRLPTAHRPARGAAADLGGRARTAAPTSPGPTARSTPGCTANDIVYTSSIDGVDLDPGHADPDRHRRRRAARASTPIRRAHGPARAHVLRPARVVARRALRLVDERRRELEPAAAAQLPARPGRAESRRRRSARWSATTSRPRSPAAARCRSSCSPRSRRAGRLHEAIVRDLARGRPSNDCYSGGRLRLERGGPEPSSSRARKSRLSSPPQRRVRRQSRRGPGSPA